MTPPLCSHSLIAIVGDFECPITVEGKQLQDALEVCLANSVAINILPSCSVHTDVNIVLVGNVISLLPRMNNVILGVAEVIFPTTIAIVGRNGITILVF